MLVAADGIQFGLFWRISKVYSGLTECWLKITFPVSPTEQKKAHFTAQRKGISHRGDKTNNGTAPMEFKSKKKEKWLKTEVEEERTDETLKGGKSSGVVWKSAPPSMCVIAHHHQGVQPDSLSSRNKVRNETWFTQTDTHSAFSTWGLISSLILKDWV